MCAGQSRSIGCGGQGVHREVESEGFEEKHRAVIEGATLPLHQSKYKIWAPGLPLSVTSLAFKRLASRRSCRIT